MSQHLYSEVRAKAPLDYKTRKALLSHWSPRVAKAIVKACYPDFKGTYEQNLWLLTCSAAKSLNTAPIYGHGSYARQAKEKGILFLWPYSFEDTRLCGPSHYMYYILNWEHAKVNAILSGGGGWRRSSRLNAKYLVEALRLNKVYVALTDGVAMRKQGRKALDDAVKSQMMLTADNQIEFKAIAYGWTHLRKGKGTSPAVQEVKISPAAQALLDMDAEIQARRR